jgi:hypothetical protein
MEEVDLEFWLAQAPAARMGAVFDMWNEQTSLKDPAHEPSRRLPRSVGGVRSRRG